MSASEIEEGKQTASARGPLPCRAYLQGQCQFNIDGNQVLSDTDPGWGGMRVPNCEPSDAAPAHLARSPGDFGAGAVRKACGRAALFR